MRRILDDKGMETAISMIMLILGASLVFSFAHDGGGDDRVEVETFHLRCVQAESVALCIKEDLSLVNGRPNGTTWILMREDGSNILEGEDAAFINVTEALHAYRPDGLDLLISISTDPALPDPVLTPHVVSGTISPGSVHIKVYLPLERGSFNYDIEGAT